MLLEKRENPKIVADLMGHARVSTTLDIYSHVISQTVYEETANMLDGIHDDIIKDFINSSDDSPDDDDSPANSSESFLKTLQK